MNSKARFTFLLFFFMFSFGVIVARLFFWQIIRGGELAVLAQKQYRVIYEERAKRGSIYFQDKTPLIINQPGFLLFGLPHEIEDKKKLAHLLSPIIEEEEASISAMINDELYWVPIKHKVDEDRRKKIEELGVKGVGFEDEPFRFYPEASMAAHAVGFVGGDIN